MWYLVCGIGEDILVRLIYERPGLLPSPPGLDRCADTRQRDRNKELRVGNFPQLQINREASVPDRGLDDKRRDAQRKARKMTSVTWDVENLGGGERSNSNARGWQSEGRRNQGGEGTKAERSDLHVGLLRVHQLLDDFA